MNSFLQSYYMSVLTRESRFNVLAWEITRNIDTSMFNAIKFVPITEPSKSSST